ncbi:hypothetical protein FGG08_006088 [Glutinoglossum americanum]|uniref:Uncharacterized protein n=1 Tax=Glutinoglossum americanum TaxID=1670608 RepID=A0A9P8HTB0_9PEZI|nr:hypothetical protein FGG08_006088 [Glutinoglossum americanum]
MSEPSHPSQRFLALPAETTTKIQRNRRIIEPVETTSKSSRKKITSQSVGTVVASVEKTAKTNHNGVIPEPTPTTTRETRCESTARAIERKVENKNKATPLDTKPTTLRKFAPQLIETTRHSRRAGDARHPTGDDDDNLPLLPHERTQTPPYRIGDDDDSPPLLSHERARPPPQHIGRPRAGEMSRRRRPIPIPPANTRAPSSTGILQYPMPRRTSSMHPHDNTRRHSFVVPSLEPIISQPNSDESNCPSLSTSPSLSSETSSLADLWRYASGMRESCDDRFSGYLLALAARAAEKQLREQAMAAYVNDDYHEPVEHFANDRESDDPDTDVLELELVPRRRNARGDAVRDSQDDFDWKARGMLVHQAQLGRRRDEQEQELDIGLTRLSIKGEVAASARLAATDASGAPKDIIGGWQKGVGLGPMRDAASPPMLGSSLKFRLCYSPRQISSELDHSNQGNASRSKNGGGLWMGLCLAKPKGEDTASKVMSRLDETPPTPKAISFSCRAEHAKGGRDIDAEIDREFNDEFVTQVYNYLSLGYPCLARKFDEELSQVSGVPLGEISSADQLANAKGYVGLGEGVGVATVGVVDGRCGRWKALRSYIREWAKQSPGMEQGGVGLDTWGVRARKGSWAI